MPGLDAFQSRFFWKLTLALALVVLATAAVTGWLVQSSVEDGMESQIEASLRQQALLLDGFAQNAFISRPPGLVAEVERMGRGSGIRITLIDLDGAVIADSEEDPALMENHGMRQEVREASTQAFGMARRESSTLGFPMLYLARRIVDHTGTVAGALGTLRVALPLEAIEERLAGMRRRLAIGAALGLGVALLLGIFLAGRITQPIARMTQVARDFQSGHYDSRVPDGERDEIGLLGATLNRLGAEITRRMATMSEEDARLRAMLAGMVEGVVAVDAEDRVVFANRAAQSMLGLESDVATLKLWEAVRTPGLQQLLENARRTGESARGELEVERGSESATLEAFAAPFAGGGEEGLVLVVHDITNLRKLEKIRRDFVANVSHELKTPLTSIRGFVETLLDGGALEDPANNRRFIEKVGTQVERLQTLVADLLSLARIESQDGAQVEEVSWTEIVESVIPRFEESISRKGLELEVRCRPATARGDREAMTQMLDNLLSNAVKYTPQGGTIRIATRLENGHAGLEVQDTGSGIPAGDLERIFERFYRVDKARSRELGGTGLGLAIVKHLAQGLEGSVAVESTVGEGSTFSVRLPAA